ncbi:MAG: T9SS type A sorting domain-containing protein [Bacteroidota bacterium]|nr:T9SS type A sorting domain-containing protein [Bacteroidota bacterium]MDP4232274.1 T9SS type A sorting domain-containing protein [Bacteroidota bacterium]MDP4241413.1 T9SS type A sorting domain-containing protein [Bacteroidota bacterium]MDP4286763.1 T9SS type A sorting domain-containing protein [Bacteroidota bacterium]
MRSSHFVVTIIAVSLFAIIASGSRTAYAQQEQTESAESHYFEHDDYSAMMRWFSDYQNPDHLPDFERVRYTGIQQLHAMPNPMIADHAAMKASQSAAWMPAGLSQSGPVSGREADVDVDRDGKIYLASPSGGLWKSVDQGIHWASLSDNQWSTLFTSAVAVDPNNPDVVYAGTGEPFGYFDPVYQGNTGSSGVGVYKSMDGGNNWTLIPSKLGRYFSKIIVNPANSNLVYVMSTSVWRSTDSGHTWSDVQDLSTGGAVFGALVIDPVDPSILYAGAGSQLFKSIDSGATWKAVSSGFPTAASGGLMVLAMTPADHEYLYVLTSHRPGEYIGYSTNGGTSWHISTSNFSLASNSQGWYDLALAASPTDKNYIVVGGLDVYSSSQNGANPQQLTNWTGNAGGGHYTHADIHFLGYRHGSLYALSDGGIYHSESDGSSWSGNMNANLGTFQQIGGDAYCDPTTGEPKFFIAGAQDNGTTKWTAGKMTGPMIQGGDGGRCFIDQQTGHILYASYPNFLGEAVIYKSMNGGSSFSGNVLNGLAIQQDLQMGYMIYSVCDADPNVVVMCGGSKLWLTTTAFSSGIDTTSTWATTSSGVKKISGYPSYAHISKSDPTTIYLGTSASQIYGSTDQGADWTKMTTPTSLGSRPTWITTSPTDAASAYLTTSNSMGRPLWTSQDNGLTWKQPTQTGLPVGLYRTVAVDAAGDIFLGHDGGVVAMDHKDSVWVPLTTGMPLAMVTAMQVRGHYLVVTTYGRGMYYIDINQIFNPNNVTNDVAGSATSNRVSIENVYPNPATSSVATSRINYTLGTASLARIAIYDNLGREERILANEWTTGGEHEKSLDLSGLPAGQHYIVLTAAGTASTKPVTIE